MSLLLHIDTAVENASLCISKDGSLLKMAENKNQKNYAAWIHLAVEKLIKETGYSLKDLNAIAVSNGPGSYTGLRVGLATAKGLCYALNIPLVTLSTLEIMTYSAIIHGSRLATTNFLYCPMIDARRMEVFTALYDKDLDIIRPPQAKIIDEKSFDEDLTVHKILFFGNGAVKSKPFIKHPNALFENVEYNASHMIQLAEQKLKAKELADIAYAEPFYIKDFHTVQPGSSQSALRNRNH